MSNAKIAGGVVHTLPADLKKALINNPDALVVDHFRQEGGDTGAADRMGKFRSERR
jgi:hypothetical protein